MSVKKDLPFIKLGMMRIIEDNKEVGVTLLKLLKSTVIEKKENGNNLLFVESRKRMTMPVIGILNKYSLNGKGFFKETRIDLPTEGDVTVDAFQSNSFIDVMGTTKGHGFEGGMKRWGFRGLRASHGAGPTHRSLGSTGCRQDPGRVFKNKKMAGHMGVKKRTILSLKIIRINKEENIIFVKGAVPGPSKSIVYVRKGIKK